MLTAGMDQGALLEYLVGLPEDRFNGLWHQAHGLVARHGPLNLDTFTAFMEMMTFDPHSGTAMTPAPHHQRWLSAAFSQNRVLILAPPESAKTTIMGVLFTLFWIGRHPTLQNMVVSASDPQAIKIAAIVAAYIQHHPSWKLAFPDIVPDQNLGWGVDNGYFVKRDRGQAGDYGRWLQERGPRKDATLVGVGYGNHSIIGKRVDGLLLVDDIMYEDNSRSDTELEYTKDVFLRTISSRPTEEAKMLVIGTMWREDDVYAAAEATGLYATFVTPALAKVDGEDVSYWPAVWPVSRLTDKRKEVGDRTFDLMYMMNRKASEGRVLEETWLHPLFPADQFDRRWPIIYGVDVALTSSDHGLKKRQGARSYFAIAKIAIAPWGLLLLDGVHAQVSLGEAIELIKTHAQVDHPRKVSIETWGLGEIFLQQLIRETGLPVRSFQDSKDKTARFVKMARHFQNRRVRMSDAATQFLVQFRSEWIRYPAGPNDTLDATANAIDVAGVQVYDGEAPRQVATAQKVTASPWGMPPGRFRARLRRW